MSRDSLAPRKWTARCPHSRSHARTEPKPADTDAGNWSACFLQTCRANQRSRDRPALLSQSSSTRNGARVEWHKVSNFSLDKNHVFISYNFKIKYVKIKLNCEKITTAMIRYHPAHDHPFIQSAAPNEGKMQSGKCCRDCDPAVAARRRRETAALAVRDRACYFSSLSFSGSLSSRRARSAGEAGYSNLAALLVVVV